MWFNDGVERAGKWRTKTHRHTRTHLCACTSACGLTVTTRCARNYTEQNYAFNVRLQSAVPLIIHVTTCKQSILISDTGTPGLVQFQVMELQTCAI
jgi:hypothetical protein